MRRILRNVETQKGIKTPMASFIFWYGQCRCVENSVLPLMSLMFGVSKISQCAEYSTVRCEKMRSEKQER